MPSHLRWSNLSKGLIALAVVTGAALGVLLFARVGALHGKTVRLYALAPEARGVLKGTEVWLAGQKAGKVAAVRFAAPASDSSPRIVMELELLSSAIFAVRKDSWAQVRAGGSFIGAQVVYVSPGSSRAAEVHSGDTLPVRPQGDLENVASDLAVATQQLPGIISDAKTVFTGLKSGQGTAGAYLANGDGGQMQQLGARMGALAATLHGNGTVGRALSGGLVSRATAAMSRADSLKTFVTSGKSSLGRFQRDSTLMNQVQDVRDELAIVGALLNEPRGTAGRMTRDSTIMRQVQGARDEMSKLFADLKRHPLRYIAF
ncbi:MAG: Mammalian cell entry related domain protein [Gemmatimonadetes bacterium]|nr:Mammalian cell entry related domain protein [Gemmatimonadota bacterium]